MGHKYATISLYFDVEKLFPLSCELSCFLEVSRKQRFVITTTNHKERG